MDRNQKETARTFHVVPFLDRIGYRAQVTPTVATLRDLHRAHLFTVPFENLDIYLGHGIELDAASWFYKIVSQRRGGFCYELNGLFAALLSTLGFSVTLLSARVRTEKGGYNPEFDHMVLLVQLKNRWLADVGFGESFLEPLCLDDKDAQVQSNGTYRLTSGDGIWQYQTLQEDESWQTVYRFTLTPRRLDEFSEMCGFHQTSPDSPFTHGALCSLATSQGRVTLTDKQLTVIEEDKKTTEKVPDEATWRSLLKQRFGIRLTD
jgi:N-hydroxyarylamine O-acetyltransferase